MARKLHALYKGKIFLGHYETGVDSVRGKGRIFPNRADVERDLRGTRSRTVKWED